MALSAVAAGPVSYSLWMHWLSATGDPMVLSIDAFDFFGTCRAAARLKLKDNNKDELGGLSCGETGIRLDHVSEECTSINAMILNYTLSAYYYGENTKSCDDEGCCESIDVYYEIEYTAEDTVNFDAGKSFPALWRNTIDDALINACFKHGNNDFEISAEDSESSRYSIDCD